MELLVGLPRMHKEAGERRDFLPEFVSFLSRAGVRRHRGRGGLRHRRRLRNFEERALYRGSLRAWLHHELVEA